MNCKLCAVSFESTNIRQKFCSKKCQNKSWIEQNKDKYLACIRKWAEQNPERRKATKAASKKRNSEYYAEKQTLRQRGIKQARPSWVDSNEIRKIYKQAKDQGLTVDHIIPLKHPEVCGLHVPWNLQLLTHSENASKNNKFIRGED